MGEIFAKYPLTLIFLKTCLVFLGFDFLKGQPSPRLCREPVTVQFPVVVKLPVSSGGLGVRVVHSETELARAWEEFSAQGDPFLQQYLAGEGVSVTGVAHEGAVIAAVMYLQHKDPADPYGPSLQQQVLSPKDLSLNHI